MKGFRKPRGIWPFNYSHRGALFPHLWDGLQACYAPLLGTTGDTVHEVTGREGTTATTSGVVVEPISIFINNASGGTDRIELPQEWIIPNVAGIFSIAVDVEIYDIGGSDFDARLLTKQSTSSSADIDWMISRIGTQGLRSRINTAGGTTTLVSSDNVFEFGERMLVCMTYDDPDIKMYLIKADGSVDLVIDSVHGSGGDVDQDTDKIVSWGVGSNSGGWGAEGDFRFYATYFYNRLLMPSEMVELFDQKLFARRFDLFGEDIAGGPAPTRRIFAIT